MRPGVLTFPVASPAEVNAGADAVARALTREHPHADGFVWLDSGLGARTGRSLIAIGERVLLDDSAPVLPQLRRALAACAVPEADEPTPLGLIGWFGYELRDETMGMPVTAVPAHHRAAWLRVDRGVAIDHETGIATLIALDREGAGEWSGELDEWRQRMLEVLAGAASASVAGVSDAAGTGEAAWQVAWRDTDEHYAELVRACQLSIREGDAYQLCLTTQVEVESAAGPPIDAAAVYRRLRKSSPAHHGALLRIGDTTLLSASPETFLRVSGGVVQTRPIKGTRPRGTDAQRDADLAAELAASDKEQAENLMIVDLMRNDLSRVCEVGSVTVTGLLEVESYAHVHQLVSTVEGRLRSGLDALDAVAACLPAGSMTGAPKRRAIELLAELEAGPRGIYSGAFGYLGADGTADLAMVIRSIVVEGSRATIGAGGGITALSDPVAEVAEMRLKAAALVRALAGDAPHRTR
jgi:anthranilate synthase component 1